MAPSLADLDHGVFFWLCHAAKFHLAAALSASICMSISILLVDDHNLFRSGVRQLLQRETDLQIVAEASDGLEGLKRAKVLRPDVILLDLNMPGLSGLETLHLLTQDVPQSQVVILTVSEEGEELAQALQAGAVGYLTKNIEADTLVTAIRKAKRGEPVISDSMTVKLVEQFRSQTAGGSPPLAGDPDAGMDALAAGGASVSGSTPMSGSAAVSGDASMPGGASVSGRASLSDGAGGSPLADGRTGLSGGRMADGIMSPPPMGGAMAEAGSGGDGGMAPVRLTAREREIMQCLARGESNKEIARRLDVAESTVKIHVQNIMKKTGLTSRVQIAVYAVENGLSGGG